MNKSAFTLTTRESALEYGQKIIASEFISVICEHGYTFAIPQGAKLTDVIGYIHLPVGGMNQMFAHECRLYDFEVEETEAL